MTQLLCVQESRSKVLLEGVVEAGEFFTIANLSEVVCTRLSLPPSAINTTPLQPPSQLMYLGRSRLVVYPIMCDK